MTEHEYNELREASWQRPLNAAEEARVQSYFALNPEAQQVWEQDTELNQLLAHVRPAPVASNFTAQVLAALDRQKDAAALSAASSPPRSWWWRSLPRVGWAAALVVAGGLGYQQYQAHQHEQLAQALVRATQDNGFQDPVLFQDFEVILALGDIPQPADEELWLALSQAQQR